MSFRDRRFDSFAARWRGTALAKFLGVGYVHDGNARAEPTRTTTPWREKSLALRQLVRRNRERKVKEERRASNGSPIRFANKKKIVAR
jgi:hypothetical protein